jgi:putative DNA primase/helicase
MLKNSTIDAKPWITTTSRGTQKVNIEMLAKKIIEENPLFYDGKEFLFYSSDWGNWENYAEMYVGALTHKHRCTDARYPKTSRLIPAIKRILISENDVYGGIFDRNNPDTIVINGGVWHVSEGKFVQGYDPNLHARSRHNITYAPDAKCPAFDFMASLLFGKENLPFIYEWFGYCLYRGYPIEKMLLVEGRAGTGKVALANLLEDFVGERNMSHCTPRELLSKSDPFVRVFLVGSTVNSAKYVNPKKMPNSSEFLHLMGKPIAIRRKREATFKYQNYAKLMFSMDDFAPRNIDSQHAILLHTTGKVLPIREYREAIEAAEKEKSGIFLKAMAGLKNVLEKGEFSPTHRV